MKLQNQEATGMSRDMRGLKAAPSRRSTDSMQCCTVQPLMNSAEATMAPMHVSRGVYSQSMDSPELVA
jgi:hypothetical protein